ncbi:hypothetical protein M422DRAFT_43325 [Sphaerobolus stellatus SS14]|nr:hypothetical protein M422DRAFT_43325 [Sphaerobolus stellatus SS14]
MTYLAIFLFATSQIPANKPRGSSAPVSIRGAATSAKAGLLGTSSKIPRRTAELARRLQAHASGSTGPHNVDVWRKFVERRYNPDAQFLNLENILGDEEVKKMDRSKGFPSAKEAAVIFKLASQLKPEVLAMSFAYNDLTTTQPLQTLGHYLPNIRNLSLANNKLRLWKDLDNLSARKGKLLHLKELVLIGNPMRDLDTTPARMERYRTEVLRRFPTLELLDSVVVAKITFEETGPSTSSDTAPGQGPTSFPLEMMGGLIAPGIEGFVAEFLTRFFTAYDSARPSLADVYGPNATFSFSANTSIPPRARVQGHHNSASMPNQKKLEWSPYMANGSRNLSRVHTLQRAEQSLHTGPDDIVKKMTSLPGSRHDITAQDKFVVDAWPIQGVLPVPGDASTVLFITVHGQFEEEPSRGVRSFDRSFILAPAEPGSRAQQAGWQVVILSDQLVIRAYSSHEAWMSGPIRMPPVEGTQPGSQPGPAPAPSQGIPGPVAINPQLTPQQQQQLIGDPALAQIPEPQRSYVLELAARTGLNVSFAIQCLQGNSWDPSKALANFEQVRVSVPFHPLGLTTHLIQNQ